MYGYDYSTAGSGGIPNHTDDHPLDFESIHSCLGRVSAVIAKDDPANKAGKFTLYQVEALHQQHFVNGGVFNNVPARGSGGRGRDSEDPYIVGQVVVLMFIGGDPQFPWIIDTYPNNEDGNETQAAQTTAQHPHTQDIRRGAKHSVDKDGNRDVYLAEQKNLWIRDHNGLILVRVEWNGVTSTWDIWLGTGTLRRLIDERAAAMIQGHVHLETGGYTGPALKSVADPTGLDLSGAMTSETKAS